MKTILSLTLILTLSTISFAQSSESAFTNTNDQPEVTKTTKKKTVLKDNMNAVKELTKLLEENLSIPESVSESNVEGKSLVNIHIDELGKIQNIKIVQSLGKEMDIAIMAALESVDHVAPIVIGGVARAKTIQLPVTLTR